MATIRIIAAAALIIGAGLVHGAWTNRWGVSPALAALGARFESVPMVLGDWKATAFELSSRARKMAGAESSLTRVYTNASRGISVSVMLLSGLPGDMTTHTPDVCYPSAGYTLTTAAPFEFRAGPDGPRAGFRTALATRGGANPSVLRIFWTWNASKRWAAPEDARWRFASKPTLCKLYIIRETGGAIVEPERDPCNDFLSVFLPEVDRLVFSEPR